MKMLPVILLLATALAAGAAAAEADPAVASQLDALGTSYEIDEDGDYMMVFEAGEGRSQLVYIRSPIYEYGAHTIREIWSPAYRAENGAFPALVANHLLEASNDTKLGAWTKQGEYAVFVVKVSGDASNEEIRDAMTAASEAADEMEIELTGGGDDF